MRSPVFLNESAYGRMVSWPSEQGWNKSTHLAKIDFGQGEEDAYVKLMQSQTWPALANEAIGWMLANACEIACPERAAILVGSAEFWAATIGKLPAGFPEHGDIAAWCTARCTHDTPHTWVSLSDDLVALAVLKTDSGRQIAAFDTWLLNCDRNRGNILRLASGRWAVIDHEMIFAGVVGNWRLSKPNLSGKAMLLQRLEALRKGGRIDERGDQQIRSAMVDYATAHQPAIARTLPYLAEILDAIEPPKTAKSVLPFIVDRAWNFWMPAAVNKLT